MSGASIVRGLIESVFPPTCAACGEFGREPFCVLCAEALIPADPIEVPGALAAAALHQYGGPVAAAIHRFKYRGDWALGRALGSSMSGLAAELPATEVIVPVPVSRAKLIERGYNQARELARGLPGRVAPRALQRTFGPDQVGLTRQERHDNLARVIRSGPQPIAGARVLLIDDVITTGATLEACVRALRDFGARDVVVLAFAQTTAQRVTEGVIGAP